MPAVSIHSLCKTYKDAVEPSLNSISLEIPRATIFGFLGPNGAGKTTTLSILCGLVKATSGSARILGKDVSKELKEIKKCIGMVPQDIALFPSLTGQENLTYFGNLYGLKGKVLENKIEHYLDTFGLTNNAHKRVSQYSGGMKRRINLIAGILHDPQLLILDEPTVGVDVQSRKMISDFLKSYNKANGITILYTSHMLDEAEKLCDEVAIIDHGKIVIQGAPQTLIAQQENCHSLEALFIQLTGRSVRDH
jgi:ABC-2 type transport system ATP-binding protein